MSIACPLNWVAKSEINLTVANLRMSCPFILLVLHQAVREQLDFRKNLRESYIFDDSPKSNPSQSSGNSPAGPGSEHVTLLEELHLQSVDVLLHSCRSQMEMYKVSLDGDCEGHTRYRSRRG